MSEGKEQVQQRSLEEAVAEYNFLVEYANALQRAIENLVAMARDAEITMNELNQLKRGEKPIELLVPLGSLVYIRAKLEKLDSVILNIGAGVYRELKVDDAISRINEYIKNLNDEILKLTNTYNQVTARISELERELSKVAKARETTQQQGQS